jgi:hypothetical protein
MPFLSHNKIKEHLHAGLLSRLFWLIMPKKLLKKSLLNNILRKKDLAL